MMDLRDLLNESMSINEKLNINVDFVDLCLPSKTKWASMNVGANSIEEAGEYMLNSDAIKEYGRNLPKPEHFKELEDSCTFKRDVINNLEVVRVIGPNNNSIVLPENGAYRGEDEIELLGETGYFCSRNVKYVAMVSAKYDTRPLAYVKGGRVDTWKANVRLISK